MRIALVSTPFLSVPPKDYGGTELVIHQLAEGLVARGHEVTLFATGDSRTAARLEWLYREPKWPPDPYADLAHVAWAVRRATDQAFDLIHIHSGVGLALGHLIDGPPLVCTLHHDRKEHMSAYYRRVPDACYVAISADQARREETLPRVAVIHHGLDPAAYEWRADPDDALCFLGRFSEVKGPHIAIDVAAEAALPIRVAGEVHPADRAFAERHVLPRLALPHVEYLGCVGMSVKAPMLRDARALLFPIDWNEPFGLVMIEAMMSGCPVVAFARGSVPEIVEHGITGFVARDEKEMADLVRPGGPLDRFDRRRCRDRAVERFSRDRMVRDHERLYTTVLDEHVVKRPAWSPIGAEKEAVPNLIHARDGE